MKIFLCTLLCFFSLSTAIAQYAGTPIAPDGLTVKADRSLAETARNAYQNEHLHEHFSVIFTTEEQFVRAMCAISRLDTPACREVRGEQWSAKFPEDIRRIIQNLMTKNYEIMMLAERATVAESTANDTTERLEDVSAQNESLQREAQALKEAYASMAALLELTSSSLRIEEESRAQAEVTLALERQATQASLEKQRELYVRYGFIGTAIALTILLTVLVSSRKKVEKKTKTIARIASTEPLKPKKQHVTAWVEVALPGDVPKAVQKEHGKDAKSLQKLYGRKTILLRQAPEQKDRGTLVYVDTIKGVFSPNKGQIFNALRKPEVIETVLSRLEDKAA